VRLTLAGFVLRRVRNNLCRLFWNHVLTSGTMAMTLFVFGAFILVQINLEHLLKGWGDQIQITLYLNQSSDPAEVQKLISRVEAFPEVEKVRHVTQEQAWRDFQIALGTQSGLLEGLPRDVLPASMEISLKPDRREAPVVEQVADRLKNEKQIVSVEYPQEWVERLGLVVLAVGWAKWIFGGVLFMATFFIVSSTAKLAVLARRDEVEIMQLVGASEELIQAPFVLEGMVLGVMGGALSVGALWSIYMLLQREMSVLGHFFSPLGQLSFLDLKSVALIIVMGCLLGAAGSVFSLRRFVRTWQTSRGET